MAWRKIGCAPCKSRILSIARFRENFEIKCRAVFPRFIIPCFACVCVELKIILLVYIIDPFMGIVAFWTGIISCFMRLFCCPCGQDLLFSSMECFMVIDEAIGIYWDAVWWREVEKEKDNEEEEEDEEQMQGRKTESEEPESPASSIHTSRNSSRKSSIVGEESSEISKNENGLSSRKTNSNSSHVSESSRRTSSSHSESEEVSLSDATEESEDSAS